MNLCRKMLAMALCLCICLSLMSCFAFAEKDDDYKIVVIGDSTANGFNLDDYGYFSDYDSFEMKGFPYDHSYDALGFLELGSQMAYPALLRDYIQKQMPDRRVSFTNLAIRGMRSDEIRYFITPGYEPDRFGQGTITELNWAFKKCFRIDDIQEFYIGEVRTADLITLDCCMNNFSNYMIDRIVAIMNNDEAQLELFSADTTAKLIGSIDPKLASMISNVAEGFAASFGDSISESAAAKLVDTVTYCYCDFCINFNAIVNRLRELNPTAQIIVGGTYNPLKGMSAVFNGIKIDVGSFIDALLRLVDLYMTGFDSNRFDYSFIDLNCGIETGISIMRSTKNPSELPEVLFKRLVTSIYHRSQMKLLDDMNSKIYAEAVEKGLDTADWGLIDDNEVFAAYDDVNQNGAAASDKSKLIYDVNERFLSLILCGAKVSEVDVTAVLSAMQGDPNKLVVQWLDTPVNELTEGQKGVLYVVTLLNVAEAVGIHPSEKGCAQKFEAAKKAYIANRPAAESAVKTAVEVKQNTVSGIINTLRAPLIDAINSLFHNFTSTLADFFAYIRNGISDFLPGFSK